jgi:TonB family protein
VPADAGAPRAPAARLVEWLLVALGTCWGSLAMAQADADGAQKVDPKFESHAEKARKEADKVFKWIRIHSDSPRAPAQSAPATPSVPPGPATKAPAQQPGAERPKAAPAARPPAAVAAPPSPGRAPGTTQAARQGAAVEAKESHAVPAAAAPAASAMPASMLPAPRVQPASASSALATEDSPATGAPTQAGAADPGTEGEIGQDAPLVLDVGIEPEFPALLTRRLRKGSVQVRLVVKPDGSVAEAEVVASSHPRLNEPALAAMRRWVFVPPGRTRQATAEVAFDLDQQ